MKREICTRWAEIIRDTPRFQRDKVMRLNNCTLDSTSFPIETYIASNFGWSKLIIKRNVTFDIRQYQELPWDEMFPNITSLECDFDLDNYNQTPMLFRFAKLPFLKHLRVRNEYNLILMLTRRRDELEVIETHSYVKGEKLRRIFSKCPKLRLLRIEYAENDIDLWELNARLFVTDAIDALERHPNVTIEVNIPTVFEQNLYWKLVAFNATSNEEEIFKNFKKDITMIEFDEFVSMYSYRKLDLSNLKILTVKSTLNCCLFPRNSLPSVDTLELVNSTIDCFCIIARFPELVTVRLETVQVAQMNRISLMLNPLHKLKHLSLKVKNPIEKDLGSFIAINDDLATPNVETLFIQAPLKVTPEDIVNLASKFPNIEHLLLSVRKFSGKIAPSINIILRKFSKLKTLHIEYSAAAVNYDYLLKYEDFVGAVDGSCGKTLLTLNLPLAQPVEVYMNHADEAFPKLRSFESQRYDTRRAFFDIVRQY